MENSLLIYPERKLSYSSLKEFSKSPASYLRYCSKPYEEKYTFARLLDAFLCDPNKYKKFTPDSDKPLPDKDFRTKVNQEWKKEQELKGNIIFPKDEKDKLERIKEMLFNDSFLREILEKGEKQKYGKGIDENTGLEYHGYTDVYFHGIGIDFKNNPASPSYVSREIFKQKWNLQAEMYKRLFGLTDYYIVVIEDEYDFSTHKLDEEVRAWSANQLDNLFERFLYCLDTGMFESYNSITPTGYFNVELPNYYRS